MPGGVAQMEGGHQRTPESTQSPIFEPESSAPSVPVAVMLPPSSLSTEKASALDVHSISPFMQALRDIEANAKLSILSWNTTGAELSVPAKRKVSDMLSDSDNEDSDDDKDPSETEDDTQKILQVFVEFLKAAKKRGIAGDEATFLWNKILKNRNLHFQDETRIAITGDTGPGKSASTNSLLGEDLTPEGDGGAAVTNVVTEFRKKKLSTNLGAVQAEVQFYCLEYCTDKLVTNWFTTWFNVNQKLIEDEDSVDDDDRAHKDAALICLEELFASRVAPVSLEDFMSSSKTLENNSELRKLLQWTVAIHGQFVPDGELSVPFVSSTHNDMREQLRPFRTRATNARYKGKVLTFNPWPFVEIVRYYSDCFLLEDGICIADVPGSKDINIFRVTAANAYLQQCEITIVVVDIKRATTDGGFRKHYVDAHNRRHHGSVILIATRSDELNDDNGSTLELDAVADEQIAPIEERLTDLSNELQMLENENETNKHEIKRLKLKIQHAAATEHERIQHETLRSANKVALSRKKTIMSLDYSLEKERTIARIACRNRFVAAGMNQMYSLNTGDDAGAACFCVSNRMYMRHRRGYNATNTDKAPTMKLEDTQIPAACAYTSGIPSQGRTAVLEHFVLFKVPMLLSIVQMSCSRSAEARIEHVTKIIDKAITDIEKQLKAVAKRVRKTFLNDLIAAISTQEVQERFDRNAERKLEDLSKMNPASHRALVNKHGSYHQKKLGIKHHLNAALLTPAKPAIEAAFRKMLDVAPAGFKAQAAQTIKSCFNDLNKRLKDDPQALAGDAYHLCFGKTLNQNENDISMKVEAAKKELRLGLIGINQKATKTGDDCYLNLAMKDIYNDALKEKPGKGQKLKDVRHAYLEDNITGLEGPFSAIAGWVEDEAEKLITKTCDKLSSETIKILRDIRTAFQRQKNRKEQDTPEGQQFRKELHKLVAEARRILDGVVSKSLEKCKEHKSKVSC